MVPSCFPPDGPLGSLDPEVADLIQKETLRQQGKVVLIASESLCPPPVAEALCSPFGAIYAEGLPSTRMMEWERREVGDHSRHLAFNRRYADRRYYKGCEYVNFIEVLAQKRAAELFAANGVPTHEIHVNVQPLSGAAANNAVYTALLEPGDLVMGLALTHGGHLSHGSPLNRSGKSYRILPYLLNPKTFRLDYDAIIDAAREHQPRLLIAGGSAYPFELDWEALQRAAREVKSGCYLLADISHPAGLVAAGLFPSPVGRADIVSMTTHKTLCGPRGAIILTNDRCLAHKLDLGVFPGEQGGPHIQQIAAKAVAFGLAAGEEFKTLMRQVKTNARVFAEEFMKLGVSVQGGGTDCHLFLVDLKGSRKKSGIPLAGDICANILDLCNITVNKNTIPGDEAAAHPTGIRIGTTFVTQQGYGEEQMRVLAGLIQRVLAETRTFSVTTGGGERGRARIPHETLLEIQAAVRKLTGQPAPEDVLPLGDSSKSAALKVRGERAGIFLQSVLTTQVLNMEPGGRQASLMLDPLGRVGARLEVERLPDERGQATWRLWTAAQGIHHMESWLRGLSDGYLLFDADLTRKIDGPVALEREEGLLAARSSLPVPAARSAEREPGPDCLRQHPELFALEKPWFIGREALDESRPMLPAAPLHLFQAADLEELKQTPLNSLHKSLTASRNMVPFAGHEMPVLYTSILEEHRAVRQRAGLCDVAHMGTLDVRGWGAARFLDLCTTNFVWRLRPGQSQYSYILRPDGSVMDDLLIYMLAPEHYMVVANAANAREVLSFLMKAAAGEARLSNERPDLCPDARPQVRDLKDPEQSGDAMKVDLTLQGPRSLELLLRLAEDASQAREAVAGLQRSELCQVRSGGFDLVVSRTGYTGEEFGYELFVHPERAADLFSRLLELGADLGVVPTGLGSRDSLRLEAGFPLHGHELAGPHKILPKEAGYGAFVKEHKPFFVGREPHLKLARPSRRRIARLRLEKSGIRMLQPGDAVADSRGRVVGLITSAVLPGRRQMALALVDIPTSRPGQHLHVFPRPRRQAAASFKAVADLRPGDKVPLGEAALVLERFRSRSAEEETAGGS